MCTIAGSVVRKRSTTSEMPIVTSEYYHNWHSVKAGMRNGMEHGTEYGTEYGMTKLVLKESC